MVLLKIHMIFIHIFKIGLYVDVLIILCCVLNITVFSETQSAFYDIILFKTKCAKIDECLLKFEPVTIKRLYINFWIKQII